MKYIEEWIEEQERVIKLTFQKDGLEEDEDFEKASIVKLTKYYWQSLLQEGIVSGYLLALKQLKTKIEEHKEALRKDPTLDWPEWKKRYLSQVFSTEPYDDSYLDAPG